jgi:hypothetical protein
MLRRVDVCSTLVTFSAIRRASEKAEMTLYRFYWIGRDGHIWAAQNVDCASDEAAEATAAGRLGSFSAVEVWLLDRRVVRIDARGKG